MYYTVGIDGVAKAVPRIAISMNISDISCSGRIDPLHKKVQKGGQEDKGEGVHYHQGYGISYLGGECRIRIEDKRRRRSCHCHLRDVWRKPYQGQFGNRYVTGNALKF